MRIDRDLATKAKYLASEEGKTQTEFLSEILRPIIERKFKKAGRKLMEADEGSEGQGTEEGEKN